MPEGISGQGQRGRPLKAPTPPQDNKIEHHQTPGAGTRWATQTFPRPSVLIYKVGVLVVSTSWGSDGGQNEKSLSGLWKCHGRTYMTEWHSMGSRWRRRRRGRWGGGRGTEGWRAPGLVWARHASLPPLQAQGLPRPVSGPPGCL